MQKKILLISVLILLASLITARIYLSAWVKDYVNKRIAALEGYGGSIEDIDIHLWRGAYKIDGLDIYKEKGGLKEPFVSVKTMDLSIEWRALLNGAIVAEITLNQPKINFAISQTGETADWARFLDSLSPFKINRLNVNDGILAYKDYSAQPNVNLYIEDIYGSVTNLNNIEKKNKLLPSKLSITGKSIGEGKLSVNGSINILTTQPSFDLDLKLTDAKLTAFNSFANEVAAISFERGTIGIFAEIASKQGQVKGYVKPILNDVRIVDIKTAKNPVDLIWESIVSLFFEILKNQPKDQFAMRIPVEGDLNHPEKNSWRGFLSIFNNAFRQAFKKNVDGTVDFQDLKIKAKENTQ